MFGKKSKPAFDKPVGANFYALGSTPEKRGNSLGGMPRDPAGGAPATSKTPDNTVHHPNDMWKNDKKHYEGKMSGMPHTLPQSSIGNRNLNSSQFG